MMLPKAFLLLLGLLAFSQGLRIPHATDLQARAPPDSSTSSSTLSHSISVSKTKSESLSLSKSSISSSNSTTSRGTRSSSSSSIILPSSSNTQRSTRSTASSSASSLSQPPTNAPTSSGNTRPGSSSTSKVSNSEPATSKPSSGGITITAPPGSSSTTHFIVPTVTSTVQIQFPSAATSHTGTSSAPPFMVTNPANPQESVTFSKTTLPPSQRSNLPDATDLAPLALLLLGFPEPVLLFAGFTIVFPLSSAAWLALALYPDPGELDKNNNNGPSSISKPSRSSSHPSSLSSSTSSSSSSGALVHSADRIIDDSDFTIETFATVPSVIVNTAFPLSWATGADGLLGAIFGSVTGVPSSTGSLISSTKSFPSSSTGSQTASSSQTSSHSQASSQSRISSQSQTSSRSQTSSHSKASVTSSGVSTKHVTTSFTSSRSSSATGSLVSGTSWGPGTFCQGLSPGGGDSCMTIGSGCYIIVPSYNVVPDVTCTATQSSKSSTRTSTKSSTATPTVSATSVPCPFGSPTVSDCQNAIAKIGTGVDSVSISDPTCYTKGQSWKWCPVTVSDNQQCEIYINYDPGQGEALTPPPQKRSLTNAANQIVQGSKCGAGGGQWTDISMSSLQVGVCVKSPGFDCVFS